MEMNLERRFRMIDIGFVAYVESNIIKFYKYRLLAEKDSMIYLFNITKGETEFFEMEKYASMLGYTEEEAVRKYMKLCFTRQLDANETRSKMLNERLAICNKWIEEYEKQEDSPNIVYVVSVNDGWRTIDKAFTTRVLADEYAKKVKEKYNPEWIRIAPMVVEENVEDCDI